MSGKIKCTDANGEQAGWSVMYVGVGNHSVISFLIVVRAGQRLPR
jgi:hypothetical protein